MILRRLALILCALVLAGCAGVVKVGPGDALVANRLSVPLEGAWNHVTLPGRKEVVWTQDGVTLDLLQFWVGLRDGQALAEVTRDKRPLTFKATMEPHELVALFQGYYALDGSTFTLDKLEPADFVGGKGIRFEFTVVRKADDVTVSGLGFAAIRDKELHAMSFTAPRLGFFPRHKAQVEQAARGAKIKG